MNCSVRPTSIGDLSKVRDFLKQAFNTSRDAYFLDPALMAWKYWDRRGDWEGPRSYVLERDGVIVAHAGIYPLTFSAGQVRGAHLIDWASAQGSPGAGFALLQKMGTMFDFLYGIGVSEVTRKILSASGFVGCAKQWRGVRTLRPLQQILKYQRRNWKVAPRLVRSLLLSSPKVAGSCLETDWKSEEIGPNAVSHEFYPQLVADACFSPRPPEFFEYLLRCPTMKMRLYRIQAKRVQRGHFAIGVLRGQARVAGVWLRDPDPEGWEAAFSLAQRTAMQHKGACEVLIAGTEGPSEQGATRSGLRIMGHKPIYILNKKGKLSLPPNFQFQLSDDDGLFLDSD
jgi:hypothetical protein